MSLVFLIGMPGAGKSYWGKAIAEAGGLPFYDMDEVIATSEQKTISHIFMEQGEAYFRKRESEVLRQLIETHDTAVISCGGGTPVWNDNLELMKQAGQVVYLKAGLTTLLDHIKSSGDKRPLLSDTDPELRLIHLLNERQKVYEQAHYIFNVENLSLANFAQIISSCTGPH